MGKAKYKVRTGAAALAVLAVTTFAASASFADIPGYGGNAATSDIVQGHATCPEGTTAAGHLVIPGGQLANGDYFNGHVSVKNYDPSVPTFGWQLTQLGIDELHARAVVVQGNVNSSIYTYGSAIGGDAGLVPPPLADGYEPIAQVEFCFDHKFGAELPKLKVKKVIVGSPNSQPGDFSFVVNGQTIAFEGDGENEIGLLTGTYGVTEANANQNGFATSYDGCSAVSVAQGQTPVYMDHQLQVQGR